GLDASGVMKVATDGALQFKNKVGEDVKHLAQHDAELAWLIKNDGPGLTPQQLNQAVADYRNRKGAGWQAEETRLSRQIAADGTALLNQMVALNQSPWAANAGVGEALKTIANDPFAGLAITSALQTDPSLADDQHAASFGNLFSLAKVGDIGRKFT